MNTGWASWQAYTNVANPPIRDKYQNAIGIVSRAMDVCGGSAFMSRHELSRLYRDVRAGPFMQPFSPTEAREYIGQIALGMPPRG